MKARKKPTGKGFKGILTTSQSYIQQNNLLVCHFNSRLWSPCVELIYLKFIKR